MTFTTMTAGRAAGCLVGLCTTLAVVAGCSPEKSFALVTVRAADAELVDVAWLQVDLKNGAETDSLRYPKGNPTSRRISKTESLSFSASFTPSHGGVLEVAVTALGAGGSPLGYGKTTVALDPRHTVKAEVLLDKGAMPPDWESRDGGARDGGAIPPREPPAGCDPTAPASCGASNTCTVQCNAAMPTMAVGRCSASGRKQAGESCAVNADCTPGSQCFKFACGKDGKDIKGLCLRFCKNDDACGAQSSCTTPVPCGSVPSGYKTCTPACDPRAPATKGCGGDGLRCFVTKGEGTACACAEITRTGGDGAKCDDDRQCEPGFICIDTAGALSCRALCRLDAPECPAGHTCEKLTAPDYKVFGGCLPN